MRILPKTPSNPHGGISVTAIRSDLPHYVDSSYAKSHSVCNSFTLSSQGFVPSSFPQTVRIASVGYLQLE